jgi:hypothetical protein
LMTLRSPTAAASCARSIGANSFSTGEATSTCRTCCPESSSEIGGGCPDGSRGLFLTFPPRSSDVVVPTESGRGRWPAGRGLLTHSGHTNRRERRRAADDPMTASAVCRSVGFPARTPLT